MQGTLSPQPGKVWPRSTAPYYPPGSSHVTIGWSFAPVYNPASKRFVAAIEVVCDTWSTPVWIAAVSSDRPDGGWVFDRRLGQYGTNCPHMKLLPNGTFALIFNAHTSSQYYPANATAPGNPPICVGNVTRPAPAAMEPAAGFLPCGPHESPEQGHDCLCSRASEHCDSNTSLSSTYMATTENWPDGPWRMTPLQIMGKGWAPYNATLPSIGTSNPTMALLKDGRAMIGFRSHAGYWPSIHPDHGSGEHIGFGVSSSIEGPFAITANLSWQYSNDEDPFVWQQPAGSLHCLYHNGRGNARDQDPNHGLHAFSTDGAVWHKPADALQWQCASHIDGGHNCSAMYDNRIEFEDGSRLVLGGRERPALLFDPETGYPTHLFNGGIGPNASVPWFAMAQRIRAGQKERK